MGNRSFCEKSKKKNFFLGGGGSGQGESGWVGQGGWERRIEAFVKIPKKNFFFGGGSGWGGGGGGRRVGGSGLM